MKNKKFLILPLSLLFLSSCNNSLINVPKSPFNDTYQRIGMKSEYNYSLSSLSPTEYNGVKNALTKADTITLMENEVKSYSYQEEYRDLEYAYFGKESSSVSRCRMTSKHDNEKRYSNHVKIDTVTNNEQIQTSNSGIYKNNSVTEEYKFNTNYKGALTDYYNIVTKTSNSDGTSVIVDDKVDHPYDSSTEENKEFNLTPLSVHIANHFNNLDMTLFGTNCIYGKFNNSNFLVKEGYSKFDLHMTKSGRKYVSSKNYFYEGILDANYRLTDFRFYTEQLILSEAWDGESIPILYLDKPQLINFTETKYKINYDGSLPTYTGGIPGRP